MKLWCLNNREQALSQAFWWMHTGLRRWFVRRVIEITLQKEREEHRIEDKLFFETHYVLKNHYYQKNLYDHLFERVIDEVRDRVLATYSGCDPDGCSCCARVIPGVRLETWIGHKQLRDRNRKSMRILKKEWDEKKARAEFVAKIQPSAGYSEVLRDLIIEKAFN